MLFYRRVDRLAVVSIGERILGLLEPRKFKSQSALARAAGVAQSTLNGLIHNDYRWSPHLPAIARALRTSVDYLVGDIDDPDIGAAPPQVASVVMMPVTLPTERALTRMFEAMLVILDEFPDKPALDERARLLAQWLPIGLSQLRDLIPHSEAAPEPEKGKELAEALATGVLRSRP